MLFSIQEHVVPTCYIREYPGATANSQEEVLHLHVKQYTPLEVFDNALVQVTLVGTHAIGFPKVCCTARVLPSSLIIVGGLRALMGGAAHKSESTRIQHTWCMDRRCGQPWSQLCFE